MEKQQIREAWENFLQYVRSHVPQEQTFDTWFRPLEVTGIVDAGGERRLMVVGPSNAFGEFVEEHFGSLIGSAMHEVFGSGVRFCYQAAPDVRSVSSSTPRPHRGEARRPILDTLRTPEPLPVASGFESCLRPDYTFANFIEGKSNKYARNIGLAIADHPKQVTFNPFFLYGPSGVGKTHLATAIGLRILEHFPTRRVLMVSADLFMRQYTDSVCRNKANEFVSFYQSVDVLIIDDIQEMTTQRTQQTFFHIFNHLHLNKRILIMTSDRPPALYEGMDERFLSRFKWGTQACLHRPDAELRLRILNSKVKSNGLSISDDVIGYIAENVSDNVRELEGVINSLMARSIVMNREIDIAMAASVISCLVNLEKRELSASAIVKCVSRHYGVKERDVMGKGRKKELVQARHLAMYLCQKYTNLSSAQIGRNIGKRDHSTVLYACAQVEKKMSTDMAYRQEVEEVENTLNA